MFLKTIMSDDKAYEQLSEPAGCYPMFFKDLFSLVKIRDNTNLQKNAQ